MYTKQSLFDTVAKALLAQGGPAYNTPKAICMYRTPEGRKCAAGHIIPDALYRPELEGRAIETLLSPTRYDLITLTLPEVPSELVTFLRDLQRAHDSSIARIEAPTHDGWLARWKQEMASLAKFYMLDASVFG